MIEEAKFIQEEVETEKETEKERERDVVVTHLKVKAPKLALTWQAGGQSSWSIISFDIRASNEQLKALLLIGSKKTHRRHRRACAHPLFLSLSLVNVSLEDKTERIAAAVEIKQSIA